MYVVNFFIVSYELCKDCAFLDIPDGAGGIDRAGTDEVVHLWVPIEGSEGSWEIVILGLDSSTFFKFNYSTTYLLSLILHIFRH